MDDTIANLNNDFFSNTSGEFDQITLNYLYSRDKRDSKAYPLRGYKYGVFIEQTFGLKDNFLYTFVKPEFSYYKQISQRFFSASSIVTKISSYNHYSYYHMKALGYEDNLRGYEPFIVDGQHFILVKNLLKAVLLPTRISTLNFIPLEKFKKIHYAIYANAYFDMAYVKNNYSTLSNSLDNTFLYSFGLGLDFVTYYDKIARIEYSINRDLVSGIYIHFKAPI